MEEERGHKLNFHVMRYLGQYTYRVAITNPRILHISHTHVSFIAKDYRDRAQMKPVKLEGTEFLRRFCQHILPKGFVKVRRFGIYHPTTKRNLKLQFTSAENSIEAKTKKKETAQEVLKRLTGFDAYKYPACKKGKMHIVKLIPRIRSPGKQLSSLLSSFLQ